MSEPKRVLWVRRSDGGDDLIVTENEISVAFLETDIDVAKVGFPQGRRPSADAVLVDGVVAGISGIFAEPGIEVLFVDLSELPADGDVLGVEAKIANWLRAAAAIPEQSRVKVELGKVLTQTLRETDSNKSLAELLQA